MPGICVETTKGGDRHLQEHHQPYLHHWAAQVKDYPTTQQLDFWAHYPQAGARLLCV